MSTPFIPAALLSVTRRSYAPLIATDRMQREPGVGGHGELRIVSVVQFFLNLRIFPLRDASCASCQNGRRRPNKGRCCINSKGFSIHLPRCGVPSVMTMSMVID